MSAVTDMGFMFEYASSFNQDLSSWDVSAVADMQSMFLHAEAFNQELRGAAWAKSKAVQRDMFAYSPGRIDTDKEETDQTGKGVTDAIFGGCEFS